MIYVMTEKEFNNQRYGGNWMVDNNGKYDNLPRETFILTDCVDSKGQISNRPFIGMDNRTGDCWVEEFATLAEAYNWVIGVDE